MGLTIHYSGMLRSPNLIDQITAEAADIGKSLHWTVQYIPPYPDVPVRGIIMAPGKSDPVWLTLHKDGFLCNPILFDQVKKSTGQSISAEHENWLITNTQYAGAEAHIAIIKLLKYLSHKYFIRFECHDDSKFWESGDEYQCRKRFGELNKMKEVMGNMNESEEATIKRIEDALKLQGFDVKNIKKI